ncbi:protein Wnt-8b-like [Oculina patagonica]
MKLSTISSVIIIMLARTRSGNGQKRSLIPPGTVERKVPLLTSIVEAGGHRGLEECQKQFKNEIWNCAIENNNVLGELSTLTYATRETALLHAITAAAITHEITLQCRENKIPGCRCVELKNRQQKSGTEYWQWGGCSDNIWYGENMTRSFIDSLEQGDNARKVVNLHNYDVGRKVVKLTMQRECLCHGVTGSCNFKTCWKSLAPFSVVGAVTKEMYHHAEKVTVFDDVLRGQDNKQVTRRDKKLVFLDSSPDYCVRNKTAGSLGLLGRTCRSDDVSTGTCKSLCDSCNLGHKTEEHTKTVRCRCKLVWCCSVECKTCTKNYSLTTCTPR